MIKVLDNKTIQKIAAGEVVERPLSIVKELVENSIDAESTDITVEIKNGGKSYIRVSDNGKGIEEDQIEKAFLRHSTSKIKEFEDLYKIFSMGFRGEALASIIAVARVEANSKTKNMKTGVLLKYEDGQLINKSKIAMNNGTNMIVTDLFYNLPVRKKFLKSDQSESNKITKIMYSFAIGNPNISFTYIRDDRLVFNSNSKNLKDNLTTLFNIDYTDNIVEINSQSENYKISGYISNNSYYKGNRSMQYIYVNNRYITNDQIVEIIEKEYHSIIPNGRFPGFQLFIDTNPQNIDVNIHPNKQKIKFGYEEELFNLIKEEIHISLLESQEISEIKLNETKKDFPNFFDLESVSSYEAIAEAYSASSLNKEHPKDIISNQEDYNSPEFEEKLYDLEELNLDFKTIDDDYILLEDINNDQVKNKKLPLVKKQTSFLKENIYGKGIYSPEQLDFKSEIFNKFLIFAIDGEDKILIVDVRAAQERISYDRYIKDLNNQKNVSQKLITPIIIDLSILEYDSYKENADIFKELGFHIEYFGDRSLAIREVPYVLDIPASEKIFINMIETIQELNKDDKKILKDLLIKKSLYQSLHLDNFFNTEKAMKIYNNLITTDQPFQSAHGQKTMMIISKTDFEKKVLGI